MKKLIGGILMAIGILITGASGLCSAIVMISEMGTGGSEALFIILLFGGIPFVIGWGLAFGGKALINAAKRDEEG